MLCKKRASLLHQGTAVSSAVHAQHYSAISGPHSKIPACPPGSVSSILCKWCASPRQLIAWPSCSFQPRHIQWQALCSEPLQHNWILFSRGKSLHKLPHTWHQHRSDSEQLAAPAQGGHGTQLCNLEVGLSLPHHRGREGEEAELLSAGRRGGHECFLLCSWNKQRRHYTHTPSGCQQIEGQSSDVSNVRQGGRFWRNQQRLLCACTAKQMSSVLPGSAAKHPMWLETIFAQEPCCSGFSCSACVRNITAVWGCTRLSLQPILVLASGNEALHTSGSHGVKHVFCMHLGKNWSVKLQDPLVGDGWQPSKVNADASI